MSEKIFITGAKSPGSAGQPAIAPRLDVEDLVKDEKQFSLYVQAIQRLYDTPENKADSHFQIAGIHGLPYVPWNNAGVVDPHKGYCEHGTAIFSTWHRPYCALYEQTLHKHAVDIAADYNSPEWLKAAVDLRIPFWDWALHPFPPEEFYNRLKFAEVTITHPDGSRGPVKNPLLSYTFKSGHGPTPPPGSFKPDTYQLLEAISKHSGTVRHPAKDETSSITNFESALRGNYGPRRSDVFRLLQYVDKWFDFGTQRVGGSGTSTNSLESIHGALHGDIGSPAGHMGRIEYAAFDPIFWLHHANVDRVLALWQAIHYESWIGPGPKNELTEMSPFWTYSSSPPNKYWTSDQCRHPTTLNYNYADFQGLVTTDDKALSQAIRKRVTDLYYDKKTFPGLRTVAPTWGVAAFAAPQAPLSIAAASAPESIAANREDSEGHQHIEWTCRIRGRQKDLRTVNSIRIFVGPVPPQSEGYDFTNDPGYAGSFDPFLNPFPEHCQNCLDGADTLLEGFVHMNWNLMQRGIDVNDVSAVEGYLRENLHWVLKKRSGLDARPEDLESLEVTVIDTPLSGAGTWANIPAPQAVRKHNEVTFDKPGGRVRVPGHA